MIFAFQMSASSLRQLSIFSDPACAATMPVSERRDRDGRAANCLPCPVHRFSPLFLGLAARLIRGASPSSLRERSQRVGQIVRRDWRDSPARRCDRAPPRRSRAPPVSLRRRPRTSAARASVFADAGDRHDDPAARGRAACRCRRCRLTIRPGMDVAERQADRASRACRARTSARCRPPAGSSRAAPRRRCRASSGASALGQQRRARADWRWRSRGAGAPRASAAAASVKGVEPLAETAMTASSARSPSAAMARSAGCARRPPRRRRDRNARRRPPARMIGDPAAVEAEGAGQLGGVLRRDQAGRACARDRSSGRRAPHRRRDAERGGADVAFRPQQRIRSPVDRTQATRRRALAPDQRSCRVRRHAVPSALNPQFHAALIACTSGRYLLYFS